MASAFLHHFATQVVCELCKKELLECGSDAQDQVIQFLAEHLADNGKARSMISSVLEGLIACPDVEECYAGIDELKSLVNGLSGVR